MIPRPILLGVVGDSAAGKTTITRGLVRLLGEEHVTHIAADDYHRYDRKQRAERGITPLDPECNYIDIMEARPRGGARRPAILKPVYRHRTGRSHRRCTSRRGASRSSKACSATTRARCGSASTCGSTSRRRRTSAATGRSIATARAAGTRPTRCSRSSTAAKPTPSASSARSSGFADIVVSFMPGDRSDPGHLDAQLTLRDGLAHPELAAYVDGTREGVRLVEADNERILVVLG